MINKSKTLRIKLEMSMGVDVIFNNAGVDNGAGRIHEYPVEVFDKIMAVDMRVHS